MTMLVFSKLKIMPDVVFKSGVNMNDRILTNLKH